MRSSNAARKHPRIYPPAVGAAFRETIIRAGRERIVGPGAVLPHNHGDIAAIFRSELSDIAGPCFAGEYANELVIDGIAAFRRQRRERDRQFAAGKARAAIS